ncbi:MAG: DsbC family protein [Pseudomonadota bacterium]
MLLIPRPLIALALAAAPLLPAQAGEAEIRRNLPARLPELDAIDEVRPAPMKGLFEVRVGTQVFYTDADGDYLLRGDLIDTRAARNLTEERVERLSAVPFDKLPLADAIVWKSGSGKRRVAVFADPNCTYCHQLERDLQGLQDVTVYTFLVPILGADSTTKARNIWCAKDRTATWRNWMLANTPPPRFMGMPCNTPLERNLALAQQFRIRATPTMIFEDGSRSSGALPAAEIDKRLSRKRG